jgi:Flp pilus assembly pilin Flp
MRKLVARFIREDQGQDLIEYALLGGVITALSAGLVTTIGTRVNVLMQALSDAIAAP